MSSRKYSDMDGLAAFGFLVNALVDHHGDDDGDTGCSFPRSDAEDLSRGLSFIPGEVTLARRRGERVVFVQSGCGPCCWYWQSPNGDRTYYWERWHYEKLAGKPCPTCGNTHVNGGHVKAEVTQ